MENTGHSHEQGFILIGMVFLMILMAMTALALNRRAGLQLSMAVNQTWSIRTTLSRHAAVEEAFWQLTKNPCLRTSSAGENYSYGGISYKRAILNSALSGYEDAVTVTVKAPGDFGGITCAVRYWISPSIEGTYTNSSPRQVCRDSFDHIYFADLNNHRIYRRDAFSGELRVVAGNGTRGFGGEGGPATEAQLNSPTGVSLDMSGNLYIADTQNHRIRRVHALTGTISTVAGNGTAGYNGDNLPAKEASLNHPCGVWVESSGHLYIADMENHRIRKVDASTGKIGTIAGTGTAGYSGNGGPATEARLNGPRGVCVSGSGDVFIADTENCWIRKVNVSNGMITTIAGVSIAGVPICDPLGVLEKALFKPTEVFVASSGELYIADTGKHRICKVDASSGEMETVAGKGSAGYSGDGGPAASAELDKPSGVCVTSAGEIVLSDTGNLCLRHVDTSHTISSLLPAAGIGLNNAAEIAVDGNGTLYIANTEDHRVRKMDPAGKVSTVAGTGAAGYGGDGGPAISAQLNKPHGVAVDESGSIYIADTENHRIRKVDAFTGIITAIAGTGEGGHSGDGGDAKLATFDKPRGIHLDVSGTLYVADTDNHCIRKITGGIITTVAGTPRSNGYSGDGGLATIARIDKPHGVFVDTARNIYIADTNNHCIRKVSAAGIISTVAGQGGRGGYEGDGGLATGARLEKPRSVFVDSSGNLFIADTGNHVIRVVRGQDGIIGTLAGIGKSGGFNGELLPAVKAQLNMPADLAMAEIRGGARIYISDTENNRVRLLTLKIVRELY